MPDSQREREKAICSCLAKPRRMPRLRRPPPARRREPGAGGEAVGGTARLRRLRWGRALSGGSGAAAAGGP